MGMKAVKVVDYSDYRQIPQLYARKIIWVNVLCWLRWLQLTTPPKKNVCWIWNGYEGCQSGWLQWLQANFTTLCKETYLNEYFLLTTATAIDYAPRKNVCCVWNGYTVGQSGWLQWIQANSTTLCKETHLSEYFVLTTATAVDYAPQKICLFRLKGVWRLSKWLTTVTTGKFHNSMLGISS